MSNFTVVKPVTGYVVALYDSLGRFLSYYTGKPFPLFFDDIAFAKSYKRKGFVLRLLKSVKFNYFLSNYGLSAKVVAF